ncbi:MAG: hypothetical protein LBQ31_07985 [Bacteroidales bacterium]|jgi:hypothetical protein|nr:hypothetical protein [Bacteroidales bacterium]
MKNKIGLSLIVTGVIIFLLTAATFLFLKKQDKIEPFFSFTTPESPFVEDVTLTLTDAPDFIDDTIEVVVVSAPPVEKHEKHKKAATPHTRATTHLSKPATISHSKPLSSSSASHTNEFSVGGIKIKVEFWNIDKSFKGYHFSLEQKKLLLFGIKQFEPLSFEKQNDKILMYYRNTPYLLEEKLDIEPLQKFSAQK